jgi:NADH-quinone oxidoreductase subunit J
MTTLFYLAAVVAIFSTIMVITRLNPTHALLYFILSLLSAALIFYTIGAPFVAGLEVIIYAGAIMVLFVFVVMLLNRGPQTVAEEREWLVSSGSGAVSGWIGPAVLVVVLIVELIDVLKGGAAGSTGAQAVDPRQVGIALFGPYVLGVELASMLLLAGLVGAYHLGRREPRGEGASMREGVVEARTGSDEGPGPAAGTKTRNGAVDEATRPERPVLAGSSFAVSRVSAFSQLLRSPFRNRGGEQ